MAGSLPGRIRITTRLRSAIQLRKDIKDAVDIAFGNKQAAAKALPGKKIRTTAKEAGIMIRGKTR